MYKLKWKRIREIGKVKVPTQYGNTHRTQTQTSDRFKMTDFSFSVVLLFLRSTVAATAGCATVTCDDS